MGNQKSSPVSNYRETRRVSYVVSSRGRKSKAATFSTELCSLNIADVREDTTSSEASVAATSSTLSELFEDNAECSDESEEEEDEEWEERLRVLEDSRKLRLVAEFFMHPEAKVQSAHSVTRCFFDRPSAPERVALEDMEEQAQVMEDLKLLKQHAIFFYHPEQNIAVTDATAFGRNYFDRASGPEQISEDELDQMDEIFKDIRALQIAASDYLHPERPLLVDAYVCARNYFSRPSEPEYETFGAAEERARIVAEARALKHQAEIFAHPEKPIETTDATMFGRNYFARSSASEQENVDECEERARILAECAGLKQSAQHFMHPERPVATVSPYATARCYFDRASGPEQISEDELDQMDEIFKDIRALQIAASDYLHPERPLLVDAYVCARNYFSRPSEPEYETFGAAEERARIVAEARALKHQAEIFAHPEKPIETADATMFGRNYFARSSASEQEDVDECEERARILAECAGLKQSAQHFMHPEIGVKPSSGAVSRNYFDRPSAPVHGKMIHTFPAHEDELDHDEGHDHLDHFGMDEELEHMFNNIRQDLSIPEPVNRKGKAYSDDGDEGNLSRSPSSVMLFAGESVYD